MTPSSVPSGTVAGPSHQGGPRTIAQELGPHLERFCAFYEGEFPYRKTDEMGLIYADDVFYRNPWSEARTIEDLQRVLRRILDRTLSCRVAMEDRALGNDGAYVRWTLAARFRRLRGGQEVVVPGLSHVRFRLAGDRPDHGKVCFHRDYFDPSEAVYEEVPLLGDILRLIKGRV